MISRSLGPALGGSSGLLFWLTYCINVTFNTTAFTDTVFATWFPEYVDCTLEAKNGHCWYKVAFSTATLFTLFLVAYRGAAAFARVNYFIFAGLVLALVVAIGSVWLSRADTRLVSDMSHLQYTPAELTQFVNLSAYYRPWAVRAPCPPDPPGVTSWCHLGTNLSGGTGYYGLLETMSYHPAPSGQCDQAAHSTRGTPCDLSHVFSFVFPAVVGMMEGANLSGDLADPGHSIPRGTIAAVSSAFGCYILLIFGQAGTMDRGALQYDLSVMQQSCVSQYFVVLGIATACLSTALGSMFGSARIMQALARDGIYPPLRLFARGSIQGDEPRRALVLTYTLAQAGLFYGGIDAVAPVLTNFFLVTYTLTNLSACLLELAGLPNFRPEWRIYSWHASAAGAILTVTAMVFLNWLFALVTLLLVCLLLVFIYMTFDASHWVDISQPLAFLAARRALTALSCSATHAKYWRPNILVLMPSASSSNVRLLQLASDLSRGGMLVAGRVLTPKVLSAMRDSTTASIRADSAACSDSIRIGEEALLARRALHNQLASAAAAAHSQKTGALPQVFEVCGVDTSLCRGYINLALSAGLGAMCPDTILLPMAARGWCSSTDGREGVVEGSAEHAALIEGLLGTRKNVLALFNASSTPPSSRDVGMRANGSAGRPTANATLGNGERGHIDVWLFGELPMPTASIPEKGSSTTSASVTGASESEPRGPLDAGLALQFAYLAHRALMRSRRWGHPAPMLRIMQLLPALSDGGHAIRINQPDVGTAADSAYASETAHTSTSTLRPASAESHAVLRRWLKELRVDAGNAFVFEAPNHDAGSQRGWPWLYTSQDSRMRDLVGTALTEHSADAALVFMGLPPEQGSETPTPNGGGAFPASASLTARTECIDALYELTAKLPSTFVCQSGGDAVVTTEI